MTRFLLTRLILMLSLIPAVLTGACGEQELSPPHGLDYTVAPYTGTSWYLPAVSTTWQWQLLGTVNTGYNVALYDIDMFDAPAGLIDGLHADGRMVICYFSAGSSEDWRADYDQFLETDMGDDLDGWEGERWLDVRSQNVLDLMQGRIDQAVALGCDGVEPDNMDGYANDSGFDLSYEDQLAYNRHLANYAHEQGLAVGLKNDMDQAADLVAYYDFMVNEECHEYDECDTTQPFVNAGKPVFNAEYPGSLSKAQDKQASICAAAHNLNIRTLLLPLDLDDSWRISCD